MKKILLLGGFVLIGLCFVYCTLTNKSSIVEVSVEISNNSQSEIVIESYFGKKKTILENDVFTFKFPYEKVNFYRVEIEGFKIPVYVLPGEPLHIKVDEESLRESVSYSGETAKESQYLLDHVVYGKIRGRSRSKRLSMSEHEDFLNASIAHYDGKKALLDSLHSISSGFDEDFYIQSMASIDYVMAQERIYYSMNDTQNYEKAYTSLNAYLKTINFDDSKQLQNPKFRGFIDAYISYKSPEIWRSSIESFFHTIDQNLSDKEVKEFAYFTKINDAVRFRGVEGVAEKLAFFKSYSSNTYFIDILDKGFQKWAHLMPGKKAPPIQVQNINGKEVSIEDYHGKVVYIDIWATWCPPCKKELPHLATLKETYKNNPNIEIVAISMDQDLSAWENFVSDHEMKGTQLWNKEAFDSEWSENYLVNSIPRFILIDADGNIVTPTAPWPSKRDELIPMIDKLL